MKLLKIPSTILVALMILGMLAIPAAMAAGSDGDFSMINPSTMDSNFIYTTNTLPPSNQFKMDIWFYPTDTQNVKGWQFLLSYPTSLLDCVGEALPAGHIFDGQTFSHPAAVVDEGAGTVSAMALLITPASIDVSANKVCTELTFKITQFPGILHPTYAGDFTFLKVNQAGGTYLINETGSKLDLNFNGAYYNITWVAPTVHPWLEVVDPVTPEGTGVVDHITATAVGQEKDVDIWIHDCAAGWEQIGIQFELWYDDTSLISFVGTADNPTYVQGTWMNGFIGDGLGIMYVVKADFEGAMPIPPGAPLGQNYFAVMIMKLPNASAKWNAPFPDGDGKLLTLKIVALNQGLFPITLSCNLAIKNVKFINQYGDEIEQATHEDGIYEITPKVLGRKIDIYTQYPDPYGGQELGQNSDMFWPQKEVVLNAKVTYNDWPEQQKDVAWQVIDPHGVTWGIFYGRTDADGFATASFRLPWPCDDPEYWFGIWTVIGTVDVACNVVNDTLHFKYDYLVNIISVKTMPHPPEADDEYSHLEFIEVEINLTSYSEQYRNITVTMTVLDETGVPFGFTYYQITIGGIAYCTLGKYTVHLSVKIPKFARAGTATIHVGALSDFPFNNGCAECPYFDIHVKILAV
jgi:hypothetical protein